MQVRYLHGTPRDKVHIVHKRDVTVPPEVGEPDEAERKRQRKARKKREQERAADGAAAGAADGASATSSSPPELPAPAPTPLAYGPPRGPLSYYALAPPRTTLSPSAFATLAAGAGANDSDAEGSRASIVPSAAPSGSGTREAAPAGLQEP